VSPDAGGMGGDASPKCKKMRHEWKDESFQGRSIRPNFSYIIRREAGERLKLSSFVLSKGKSRFERKAAVAAGIREGHSALTTSRRTVHLKNKSSKKKQMQKGIDAKNEAAGSHPAEW